MKENMARWAFVVRTRFSVAYANFAVNRAFGPKAGVEAPSLPSPALMMGAFLLFAGLGLGTLSFMGKVEWQSTPFTGGAAQMPAVAHAQFPDGAIQAVPREPAYTVAVDKANKLLLVLEEKEDHYQVVRSFDISLGKIIGEKQKAGDMRTPVGYYRIVQIKEAAELPNYYGPRAFVTDYPNSFDIAQGRTGGGIWLHGTGLGRRTPDSRGCVVLDDESVTSLGRWVRVNTPVAIFPEHFQLPVTEGRVEKRYFTPEFFYPEGAFARRS